jgi:putative endonuclease
MINSDAAPQDEGQDMRRSTWLKRPSFIFFDALTEASTSEQRARRFAQHNAGTFGGYTATRRPVTLVFSQWFDRIADAIENERKLKKWSRAKKKAFIRGDYTALRQLSARRSTHPL